MLQVVKGALVFVQCIRTSMAYCFMALIFSVILDLGMVLKVTAPTGLSYTTSWIEWHRNLSVNLNFELL